MDQESTSSLMHVLRSADPEDLPQYTAQHLDRMNLSFPAFMDACIARQGITRQALFQKADIPGKYGYKLLSGERHTTDRDKLLRLFYALKLSLKEVQRALALYGLPGLYPKFRRDAVLIIAFNQGVDSVDTVDEWLIRHGEAPLSRSTD